MTLVSDPARELSMSRTYRAPRDLVLRMFSDPEHLNNWWGPFGFRTTTHKMEFRPGGVWDFTMHGPDGVDYPNYIRYVETGPDRIVYDHGTDAASIDRDDEEVTPERHNFKAEITLEEVDGMTRVQFRMQFRTAQERHQIVEEFGADDGLTQTMTRLDTILADQLLEQNPFQMVISLPSDTEIRIVRSFRAPQDLVFEAFNNAEHIPNWQGPRMFKCLECAYDPRVDGKWHSVSEDPEGNRFRFYGDILQFERPRRVVSTFQMEGMDCYVQHNTTTFEEVGGTTRVTILSSYGSKEERDGMLASGMEWGMNEGYERLDDLLAGMAA